MPAQGVIMTDRQEGLAQLALAMALAGLFALLYLGRDWGRLPTPVGIDLGDTTKLVLDGLWLVLIVWAIVSPLRDRNVWTISVYLILFPLMHLATEWHVHTLPVIATSNIVVAAAGVLGGLSIIARRLWGAR